MTRDDVRAAAKRVTRWHERFAGLFGRKEPRGHSLVYVKGLMSGQKRKSVEPMALQFARGPNGAAATQNQVVALQGFLTHSPWEAMGVFQEIQTVFREELVPSTAEWPLGTVGVIDESGFKKAGTESVGVASQWCGRLGKTENCQVGVFLIGVTPGGVAGLDAQLFLTEASQERRRAQGGAVPNQAAARGEDGPADACGGQGAVGLDRCRLAVWRQRGVPRRLGSDGPTLPGRGEK